MTNELPNQAEPPPSPEAGTVRWFNAAQMIGVINRRDGSTVFIPAFGRAVGQGALRPGQSVTFVTRENEKGFYADEVTAIGETPPLPSDVAIQIAAALGETISQARTQIRRIVRHLGPEDAQRYVAEAQRVEAAGGMLLPDGSRRRTLGGVFFVLIRNALPEEERKIVFPPPHGWKAKKKPKDTKQPAEPPPLPPLGWDDRITLIETLRAESGKATTVKVTIIGRPGQIEERPQVTLLTLTHTGPLPALPKGIPVPNPVPPTTYSVYIGKKQWKAIAEAIANPEDTLIVEGTQILDAASGTITVFATKTTTKLLQQASKQPKPPVASEG